MSIGCPPHLIGEKDRPRQRHREKTIRLVSQKIRIISFAVHKGAVDKGMKPARAKVYPISHIRFNAASNAVVKLIDGQ